MFLVFKDAGSESEKYHYVYLSQDQFDETYGFT